MNKKLSILILLCLPVFASAAGGSDAPLYKVDINLENKESLQRGAKLFVNYCLSCHSAKYMRYNRMARDLGLSDEMVEDNMIFRANFKKNPDGDLAKVGETMQVAMTTDDGKAWFGNPPPDLTVIARSRGADWLYTYMKTFYLDDSRPFGMNNARFKSANMPHVLWELEGLKKPVKDEHGKIVDFEFVQKGTMEPEEYDRAVSDLVNFLVYMGEPGQQSRKKIGFFVIAFLVLIMLPLSYFLKKEYWKDVH